MKKSFLFRENNWEYFQNPAMGWVVYIEESYADLSNGKACDGLTPEEYWQAYDRLCAEGDLKPAILYIRLSWNCLEREEGSYAWREKNNPVYRLIQGAEERKLQLAFRIVLDSADSREQAVPEYVFTAGAGKHKKYPEREKSCPDAYINDPVFLGKFERFLAAFAETFDDGSWTAYIDAEGMGDWGEVNRVFYDPAISDGEAAVDAIIDLYRKYFHEVLLGAQFGSDYGYSYGETHGCILRRDSFGSPQWLPDTDKESINRHFMAGNSVYTESCYHGLQHELGDAGRWQTVNRINGWPLGKVLQRVADDAIACHANTLDYRMLSDMECWVKDYPEGTDVFALQCGYRLTPVKITIPESVPVNGKLEITHSWKNNGIGRFPNNRRGWDYKYRVAFALFDEVTGEQKCIWITPGDVEPADWIRELGECEYQTVFSLPEDLEMGQYDIGCAIVNTKRENRPEIQFATAGMEKNSEGWYVFGKLNICEKR